MTTDDDGRKCLDGAGPRFGSFPPRAWDNRYLRDPLSQAGEPMPFEEYDITFSGVSNALGLDLIEGVPPALEGGFADYKVRVVAVEEPRGGKVVPLTRVLLAMPTQAEAEVQVATRGAEALFGVPPTLPPVATGNKQFEAKLVMRSAQPDLALKAVIPEFQNKLSVMEEQAHLWVKGSEAGFEIVGENPDANHWVNMVEMLGKVADRVRRR